MGGVRYVFVLDDGDDTCYEIKSVDEKKDVNDIIREYAHDCLDYTLNDLLECRRNYDIDLEYIRDVTDLSEYEMYYFIRAIGEFHGGEPEEVERLDRDQMLEFLQHVSIIAGIRWHEKTYTRVGMREWDNCCIVFEVE